MGGRNGALSKLSSVPAIRGVEKRRKNSKEIVVRETGWQTGRLADWQCTGVAEIEVGNGLRQLKRTGTGTSPGDSCSVGPDLVGLVGFVRCRCATVLMVSWVR